MIDPPQCVRIIFKAANLFSVSASFNTMDTVEIIATVAQIIIAFAALYLAYESNKTSVGVGEAKALIEKIAGQNIELSKHTQELAKQTKLLGEQLALDRSLTLLSRMPYFSPRIFGEPHLNRKLYINETQLFMEVRLVNIGIDASNISITVLDSSDKVGIEDYSKICHNKGEFDFRLIFPSMEQLYKNRVVVLIFRDFQNKAFSQDLNIFPTSYSVTALPTSERDPESFAVIPQSTL